MGLGRALLVRDGYAGLGVVRRWQIDERHLNIFALCFAVFYQHLRNALCQFAFLFRRAPFHPGHLHIWHKALLAFRLHSSVKSCSKENASTGWREHRNFSKLIGTVLSRATRLRRQFCPAARAIRPAALHGMAATRACGLQCRSTMRTEYES